MGDEIFESVAAGDEARLAALLDSADLKRLHNAAGESLYRFALFHGHAKAAEAIRQRGGLGLHDAALTGDVGTIEALFKAAPWAIDLLSPDGWTALHLAAFAGADAAVETLLALGASAHVMGRAFEQNLAVHAGCAGRRIGKTAFARLVAATGDPDALQKQGYSALMIAAGNGFGDAVAVLLAAGADKARRNGDGKTAADFARERGHAELAARLA
jgi:ankyrin repeat protein